jgi:hypothetical protein
MPDKIKEAFEATKSNGIFLDEQDFRDNLTKDPKAVFDLFKSDKAYGDLFLDYSDFETSLDLKKKDFQGFNQKYGTSYTREQFTGQEPISQPTSSTVSLLPSSQPKSTTPSVSTEGVLRGSKTTAATPQDFLAEMQKSSDKTLQDKDYKERKQYLENQTNVNLKTLPTYEQSQQALRDADVQLNSYAMLGDVDRIPDLAIRAQAQAERDALLQNRKGLAAKAHEAQVLIQPEIDKLIKNSVDNKGLDFFFKQNVDGEKVPDEEKINLYSKTIASSAGLADDGYAKTLIYNNFKSSLQYQKDKPVIEKKFNELYQKKYGTTPESDLEKDAIQGFTAKKEIESNLQNQGKILAAETKVATKTELAKVSEEYTPKVKELNETYEASQADLNEQMKVNAELYKNNLISFEDAKKINNALKAAFQQNENEYKANFQAFSDEYLNVQKEVIGRYDKRYKRQSQEAVQIAEQRLREEAAKYGKTHKVSPEIEKRYNETWKEASGSYYAADEALRKIKDDIKGGGVVFAESLVSGLGDGLKTLSSFAGIDEGVVMGDYLNSLFTLSSPKIDSAKDLLDMTKLARSAGQMIGGMTPMIATQVAVAALTEGASIPTQLMLQGGIGFTLETMQNAGGAYDDKFAETGNVAAAERAAQMQVEGNVYLLPLYALDGLPFVSEATLGIKNVFLRGLAKGGIETLTELPQEYFQGIFEDLARENKGLGDIAEKMTLDRLKDTALNIIPSTFAMGAIPTYAGGVNQYVKDINTKAFAAKQDLARMSTTALQQYLYGITLQRGESFAKAYLSGLQQNGSLRNVDLEQVANVINTAKATVENAAKFNLNKGKSRVYSYFMLNQEMAKADFETAETLSVQKAAEARMKMYEEAAVNLLTNGKGDYAVITLANNEQYVANFQEMKSMLEDPRFSAKLAKGEIEVTLEKDKQASDFAALTEQINQIKQNEDKQKNNEVSSRDTGARTDNTGTEDGNIASVTDKGESGKNPIAATEEVVPPTEVAQESEAETAKRFEQEKVAQDEKIAAFQQQFGYEPYNPFSSMPAQVGATIMRVQDEQPVSLTAIEEASKHLYDEYKRLEAAKKSDSRQMTIPQIEAIQQELDQEITDLENYKNKLYENAGETEATPLGQDNRSAEEGARTEPTAKPKAEEVERTPATEANVVKNPILKRLNRGFLKIGTTIFDNAKQLMDKAKELTGKGEKVQFNITMPDGSQKTVKRVHSSIVDGFYSNTENALEQVKQDKMSGNQWATQLLSRGANKEEMAWTGLEGFLKENAAKSISKADIQQYLKDNRISVVEVVKAEKLKLNESDWTKNEDGTYTATSDDGLLIAYDEDYNEYVLYKYNESIERSNDLKALMQYEWEAAEDTTKFSQYQLEGEKENYKEVLVTLPNKFEGFIKEYNSVKDEMDAFVKGVGHGGVTESQRRKHQEFESKLSELKEKIGDEGHMNNGYFFSKNNTSFQSSHFDEPNILVHLRMNTRIDSKGNKVLFLEEVQSDWGQEGKKRGFEQPVNVQAIEELKKEKQKALDSSKSYQLLNDKTEGNLFVDVFSAIQQIATNMIDNKYSTEESRKKRFLEDIEGTLRYWSSFGNAVPKMNQEELSNFYDVYIKELENNSKKISGYDTSYRLAAVENKLKDINKKIFDFGEKSGVSAAPFVTDTNAWTKLGLKVALKEAVKQGVQKLAWTTGEQQNERYDLRKQVDKIEIIKREGADSYRAKTYRDGEILEDQDYIAFNELEGMFGKEIAKKVQDGKSVFEGEGLAVGGKGMKGFYGSPTEGSLGIVGNVAKSLFKQEPKTVSIDTDNKTKFSEKNVRENGVPMTKSEAVEFLKDYTGNENGILYSISENGDVKLLYGSEDIKELSPYDNIVKIMPKENTTQHSINITPELKEGVEEGLPLFHYNDKGEILGFTHNGKIYLNGEKITAKTTMEEAGHIWTNWAKENSVDLYKAGLSKVKGSKYLSDVEANKNYQKEALKLGKKGSPAYNTYMREEALAKAIADNGAKFVTETRKNDFIQWVNEMWKQVAQAFGIRNLTTNEIKALSLEEFAKRAAADVFARDQFSDNILDIAEETGLSPQEVERTYKKYEGSKAIEDITIDDYLAARATGDKVKLEATAKAFDALLQVESAETSVSPSAKKNAEKKMKEADEKALKEAARIMEHIDEIRSKLQENGVIEAVHCKWGK